MCDLFPSHRHRLNVLNIFIVKESEGYKEEKVIAPMVAMKGGKDYQRYVDILIP